MSNSLHRIGTSYVVPARPFRAARPAYISTSTTTSTYGQQSTAVAQAFVPVTVEYMGTPGGVRLFNSTQFQPAKPSGMVSAVARPKAGTTSTQTLVPADAGDPGAPAQRTDFPPMGWTSFGRSIQGTHLGGVFRFTPTKPATGIAIGATPYAASPASGYAHITHGLMFTAGEVRSLRTGAFYGTYSLGDEFSVITGSTVTFSKNGSTLGSEASTLATGETLYLGAAFYAAGDSVDDPTIEAIFDGTSTANMPAFTAASADSEHAESRAVLPALAAESDVLARSLAVLPGLAGASSQAAYAQSLGAFPALTGTSYGGTLTVVSMNTSSVLLAPLAAASVLLVGETGSSEGDLAPLVGLASDRPYGESLAIMKPVDALTGGMVFNMAAGVDFFLFTVWVEALTINTVDVRDTFDLSFDMAATSTATVDARDAFEITVAMSAIGDGFADARDAFTFAVALLAADDEGDAWAVNLDGFGSTTYSNFRFNSFANVGGRYFGAAMTGIHELDGDTDAGAPIRASVDFGDVSFGNSLKKTVSEAYLGMSASGHLLLKINAEGREFIYRTRSYSEHMQQQRVTLGKGLRPNYAGLQLFNEDGADFALDSVEFVPITLSRRT